MNESIGLDQLWNNVLWQISQEVSKPSCET